jgi:hypothetical protein
MCSEVELGSPGGIHHEDWLDSDKNMLETGEVCVRMTFAAIATLEWSQGIKICRI